MDYTHKRLLVLDLCTGEKKIIVIKNGSQCPPKYKLLAVIGGMKLKGGLRNEKH